MPSLFTPYHRGGAGPPLLLIHGFTDTWRTWDLVLDSLESSHEVLAPTLAGHAGGPPLAGEVNEGALLDELAHQIRGAADCSAAPALIGHVLQHGWWLDAEAVRCPVRIVWGAADRILTWESAARRYREEWLPVADRVILDDVGHCPRLDVPLETAELIRGFTSR